MVFTINLLDYSANTKNLIYILGLSVIIYSYQSFFAHIFRGYHQIGNEIKATFAEKPLLLLLTFIAI